MANPTLFSKLSAVLGIASMHKLVIRYREDPFFRSTINVVAIQALLVLLTVLIFAAAFLLQQNAIENKIAERRAQVAAGEILDPKIFDDFLSDATTKTLGSTLGVLVFLALVFGFLSARYALEPTRRSLGFQKRFIGDIAHELRTPLSIIRTNAEVALMDKSFKGYGRDALTTTVEELDRISGIINNLLSFDALTRPGSIRHEPVQLREIASAVLARYASLAQQYGINIGIDSAEEPSYVMGDRIALEQAVSNLVKNALNYTPQHEDRSVLVRIDEKETKVAISVIDTGIGIAQKDLYYVFQPFFRGDTGRERGIGSGTSGLGLAIVNDIVRLHGGTIIVRSALNRGTTIELCLPKADTREHVQNIAAEEDGEEHEEQIV